MSEITNILRVVTSHGEPFDCECCGSCFPEGVHVEYNGEIVWERSSDGHYSGSQTEDSISKVILDKWLAVTHMQLEADHTEQKRHEWNKQYPGNGVARTIEAWAEYKQSNAEYINACWSILNSRFEHLPDDIVVQVKMIALWFEAEASEAFEVEVTSTSYQD